MTAIPAGGVVGGGRLGRLESMSRMIHGAATPSRAALTTQDCRASTSARIATSCRSEEARLRSTVVSSLPPTSRDIRSVSRMRSATGSASRAFSASTQIAKLPVAR